MSAPTQTREERDKLHAEWLLSGRTIEVECFSPIEERWVSCANPSLPQWREDRVYRRKPIKRTVPLGPEDIKPGMVFRWTSSSSTTWVAPSLVEEGGVFLQTTTCFNRVSWELLRWHWLYSTDGVTWHKCEKEVEA